MTTARKPLDIEPIREATHRGDGASPLRRTSTMCMIDSCDDRWDWSNATFRTARKEHECIECNRVILRGERYEILVGKYDGSVRSYKTCLHCVSARSWLDKHCGGSLAGGVEEDLREHFDESYREDRLGSFIAGMRRKWKTKSGRLMTIPNPVQA